MNRLPPRSRSSRILEVDHHNGEEILRRKYLKLALELAALVRMLATIGVLLACLAVGAWLAPPEMRSDAVTGSFCLAIPLSLLVAWLTTLFYCRRAVTCPRCGQSLWSLGTGNFKPGRVRVRPAAVACPGCEIPILDK